MDILILAAAIFGLSGLVSRYHLQPLFAFPCVPDRVAVTQPPNNVNNHNSLLCAAKPHVYSRDRLKDLNRPSLPAPAPHVSALLAINGILTEPLHHAARRHRRLGPHRKTKRGTRGGRRRRIHTVTGHRPPPTSPFPSDCPLPTPADHVPDFIPRVNGPTLNKLTTINCPNVLIDHSPNLNCLYLNTRSCKNKVTEINDLIIEKDADLVFITETWLKDSDNITKHILAPPGYNMINKNRQGRSGGGVAIIYRSSFEIVLNDVNTSVFNSFEHCCFKILTNDS